MTRPTKPANLAAVRRYRNRNPQRVKAQGRDYYARNRESCKAKVARARKKARLLAIAARGGCCERCGFADQRALQFDHVQPLQRGKIGRQKASMSVKEYEAVINGTATNIQLLCANCHAIKTTTEDVFGDHVPMDVTLPLFDGRQN